MAHRFLGILCHGKTRLFVNHYPIIDILSLSQTALALVCTCLFVEETFYDRRLAPSDQPLKGTRLQQILGISQYRSRHLRNSFGQACSRPIRVIIKPTVFLSSLYYTLTFAWVVGINTTLSIFLTPLYNFGPLQIGYFYFTPVVAALIGEVAGHWLHDWIAKSYIHSHKGHFEPEVRLRAIWLSTPFMIAGLIGLGFALEDGYHYMVTAVFWGLYVFGIMITTVALNAYNLDSYPEASGEVAAWLNFARSKFVTPSVKKLSLIHRQRLVALLSVTSRLHGLMPSEQKQVSVLRLL